ncbi:ABC transporter substrate-binding protein [Streptomyces sp. NPDC050560]|uniref:ABC transporter substrate-binding protein n=1 Tax=Streptomyces sp. NPDC050560 TaxID=3365630 RepID=UPI0037A7021A
MTAVTRRRFLTSAGGAAAGGALAGCGTLAGGGKGTLRFFHNETDPATVSFFHRAIAAYERDHPRVHVEMELVSTDGRLQRLLSMQAIRRLPGIFKILPEERHMFAKKGMLEPLDDVVDRIGRDDFVEHALIPIDGVIYDIPYTLDPFSDYWYRDDLLTAKGLRPATTWREFADSSKELRRGAKTYGTAIPASIGRAGDIFFAQVLWSQGGTFFDKDFAVSLDRGDAAVRALEIVRDLAAAAPPGIKSYSYDDMVSTYVSGQIAQVVYDPGVVTTAQSTAKDILAKTRTGPLLIGDSGIGIGYQNPNLFTISTKEYGNPDVPVAKDFLRHVLTGSRALEFSLTDYPNYVPPLASIQKEISRTKNVLNDAYGPLVKRAFDLRNTMDFTREAGARVVDGALVTTGTVNPHSRFISDRFIGANLMQEAFSTHTSLRQAVKKWADELRKAVDE